MMRKKQMALILSLCLVGLAAAGCQSGGKDGTAETTAQATTQPAVVTTDLPKPDMTKWQYNENDDVYYQIGITYCEKPADESYEKLAIFVPGAYMDAKDNGNGTYTCTINESAQPNGYTAAEAPIVMPIYTPGYAAARALNAYEELFGGVTEYTSQGMVFVCAGCRGLEEGAPTGVTDLKAAIRYLRYCDDTVAGDAERIFVFGMSGGGAQSAVLGAAGDSQLYEPYLKAIGAVEGVSDAVYGSMSWCPITDLDTANAGYEWMMGCTRSGLTKETQAISDRLATAFAEYVNSAGFTDKDGNALTLTESSDGIYQAGTYYDHIKREIERSLNNYLSDTQFSDPGVHSLYKNAGEYIDALNADGKWITYDESTNTVTISSVADFAKACKNASDTIVAFDQPQSQNTLFGYGDGNGAHFDKILADILTELHSEYAADYEAAFKKTDALGYTVAQRVNMYAPLYYLMPSREGFGTSSVAKYWRIRSGITQKATALTTEVNLALALEQYEGVRGVDFETVWEQEHSEAERTGDSVTNFIEWVNACMKEA